MDAERLGCLYIPDFRIQIHQRDEGIEPTRSLVLLVPSSRQPVVTAASATALAAGVRVGMTHSQASMACPDALYHEARPATYASAGEALLERFFAHLPCLEIVRLGLYYFGMRGLRWLFQDEEALLRILLSEVARVGLVGSAGAGGTRFATFLAARLAPSSELKQIPFGRDRQFLAPLPLPVLEAPLELQERLTLLGISNLGQYAALPPQSIERRYGAVGLELYRRCRAEDGAFLTPTRPSPTYVRNVWLEDPVINAEGLLFVLAPQVKELLTALSHQGRAISALSLTLTLDSRDTLELPLLLGTPVTRDRPILDLLRLKLLRLELPGGVLGLRLEATQVTEPSTPQGDLFERVGSPSGMAVTLARLTEALGRDAVVTSQVVPAYLPEQRFRLKPVAEGAPRLLEAAAGRNANVKSLEKKALETVRRRPKAPTKRIEESEADPLPLKPREAPVEGPSASADAERPEVLSCSFRRVVPPQELTVRVDGDGPISLTLGGQLKHIHRKQGPFRFSTRWWEHALERDYYLITLRDGVELLLSLSRKEGIWHLEGGYD